MKRSFLCVLLSIPCLAGAEYRSTHGLSGAEYQRWFDRAVADGFRVTYASVSSSAGTPRHAAVAVKDGSKVGWLARTGLTSDEFARLVAEQSKKGLRPTCVSGYLVGEESRYAAVWVHDPRTWRARHGLSAADYQKEVAAGTARGLRPDCISVHADSAGVPRFAAVFVADKGDWLARHDLTAAEYQAVFDTQVPRGFRPVTVSGYLTPLGPRFAASFVKGGPSWRARHDLTPAGYQAEFARLAKQGYRPACIAGYVDEAGGNEAFDEAMRSFMKERSIPTGTITVARGGRILFTKGYGFADRDKTRPILPSDPFRIASLSKPITAAAVRDLIARGKFALDTKAFAYLGLAPAAKKGDPRLKDITIGHLLEHKGGWDRDASFDPMFRPLAIAEALGKPGPASADDVIRYMLGQPLDFAPGEKRAYSNFGYCVLGRVVEKATGQSYVAHIQKELLAPLKIASVELGRSLPALRNKREPFYADPGKGRNVLRPASKVSVPAPDGTFHLEAMDAHGGLIASSEDLARFMGAYWISGERRKAGGSQSSHFGSLPGTFTLMLQHPSGLDVAALFDQRADPSKKKYEDIEALMRAACKRAAASELRYAAIWVKE